MKKSTSKSLLKLTLVAVAVVFSGLLASAQPKITNYYPGNGFELKPNASAYVYFDSDITYAKARVTQNGQELGVLKYIQDGISKKTANMNPSSSENRFLANVNPGEFTLDFIEVGYLRSGNEEVYNNEESPLGTVTYIRKGEGGRIVSETGFSDGVVKSYYAEDNNDGLKTFTFSKPIGKTGLSAYYEYGAGNSYFLSDIPFSISEDGLTLSLDVRGECYNVERLAPGHTFLDDNGNQTTPPTSINLNVSGIKCEDGTDFVFTIVSPDGARSIDKTGVIFQNYDYRDLTFPNPALDKAEFYANANPADRFINISQNTDMMDLFITNSQYIASCDIKLSTPKNEYVIPASDIKFSYGVFTVALPAGAIAEGSSKMVVSLENVVFSEFDGAPHVIRPLNLSNVAIEVQSLAALKQLEPGTDAVISVASGIVVTLSNEAGYTFAEDENDGIQIVTEDYSKVFDEGMCLNGKIAGKYLGNGMFMINVNESTYTISGSDIFTGQSVDDIDAILSGAYDNRLVTITNSDDTPIVVEDGYGIVAGSLIIMTEFIEDYILPEDIENVTGVVYKDAGMDTYYLLLRNEDDVNKDLGDIRVVKSIEKLVALPMGTPAVLKVSGAKVTYSSDERMMSFLEDETGAILIGDYNGSSLIANSGKAINGYISGVYFGQNMFAFSAEESSYTTEDVDITKGTKIRPEVASDPANIYRLVTFENTPETPFTVDDYQISVGNFVAGVDYFEVFDEDFTMPANVKSFTGIIMPNITTFDLMDEETEQPALVAFRWADDIELSAGGVVGDIDGDGTLSVADVVVLCNYVLSGENVEGGDLDNNGSVTVSDIVVLVNMILGD